MYSRSTVIVLTIYYNITLMKANIILQLSFLAQRLFKVLNLEIIMRAIVIDEHGETDQLTIKEIPSPEPQTGEVLIQVQAFGINRAEIYMRRGQWGDVAEVSGIECVGKIVADHSGEFSNGQTIAAIMGGMGRTRNGSYAEYVCVSASNVFAIETNLSWSDLAAIPESYATAWSCLHENMKMKEGDTVFIRGGTSSLGQAAINIASNIPGVDVISSTRSQENVMLLESLGCSKVLLENGNLSDLVRKDYPNGINCVMDIIGNSTLLDSARMLKKDGIVCNAGFLAGGDPISFNPLTDMPPSVNLNWFASFMLGTEHFPMSNIPMQKMVECVENKSYKAKPVAVFDFENISKAHQLMESNKALGKIVVKI